MLFHRGDPRVEHGIGVSKNCVMVPLASSSFETRPAFFLLVVDAILMHEPGHERERRMFGISADSITKHLAGGGSFEELYVGAKDYELGYSVPPMGELKKVIEADALLGRHIRRPEVPVFMASLDLHCDARAFRDAESEVYVSEEQRKARLGGRAVYLSQMLLYVGYQYAKLRVYPGRVTPQNIPQLARFSTVLRMTEDDLRTSPKGIQTSIKDELVAAAMSLPDGGGKADIAAFCDGVVVGKASVLFEDSVRVCLPAQERELGMTLYSRLSEVYRKHLLLCVNRGERIVEEIKRGGGNPVQTLLSDLNDPGDERLRVRAATYLGEVGDLVSVDPLIRRFMDERSRDVREAIVDTLLGICASALPRRYLRSRKSQPTWAWRKRYPSSKGSGRSASQGCLTWALTALRCRGFRGRPRGCSSCSACTLKRGRLEKDLLWRNSPPSQRCSARHKCSAISSLTKSSETIRS